MGSVVSWTHMAGLSAGHLARQHKFIPMKKVLTRPNGRRHGRLRNMGQSRAERALADRNLVHFVELPASDIELAIGKTQELIQHMVDFGVGGQWSVLCLWPQKLAIFGFEDSSDAVHAKLVLI